jgi:hypothetical protein
LAAAKVSMLRGEEHPMFKAALGIVALTALISISPVAAAEMDCTEANMTKAGADMDKMASGEKKTLGMKEMTMAKEMMEKKDMAGCKMHMNKAMEMGMK